MLESVQGVEGRHHFQDDIPAFAAIAAIRPAARYILLAAEMDDAIPAFARLYKNFCFIDKHAEIIPHSLGRTVVRKINNCSAVCAIIVGNCTMRIFVVNSRHRSKEAT